MAHSVPQTDKIEEPTLPERYLAIYVKVNEAEHLEAKGDYRGAREDLEDCYTKLASIHESYPRWESALVGHRMDDCKGKILELQEKSAHLSGTPTQVASGSVNATNSTGAFVFLAFPPKRAQSNYPWKEKIITTNFWIGERSTKTSAWNAKWTQSNNGEDSPQDRSGYAPAKHASSLNPFYVALPFNDLAFPKKARQWLPTGWQQPRKDGKPVSACQHRWVEIKNAQGRLCFAQWEDVGPMRNDYPEYVFGNERPGPGAAVGLCVSPAVAQYLGLDGNEPSTVSWRFVDDENVPPGAWLKYDEQAVLFSAMHHY